ncbi:UTP--glucose-1-phosphate uridylyltransferase [Candidatus Microgenomates bacterium]|nr:UTP--glucose-1-phosphate uridylyltransferase [Candidatus Microgenomates bacterium]
MKIKKVVIPAAGFGTRFLPATKAMPKEMLPIVDKPIIQYVVEEAVEAGIEDIIIVTGSHKRPIEDHFDYPFELEQLLIKSGKEKELAEVRRIAQLANFIYVRQKGPIGNATPILNARHLIGNEPFLVLWGDDFIVAKPPRTRQLMDAFDKYGATILGGVRTTSEEDTRRYGYAAGEELKDGVIRVKKLIEKPGPSNTPSNLATVSGFIFTPEIFDAIEEVQKDLPDGKELIYIDALNVMMKKNIPIYASEIKNAVYYDTGNKLEYLKTVIQFALKHKELNGEFRDYLKNLKV